MKSGLNDKTTDADHWEELVLITIEVFWLFYCVILCIYIIYLVPLKREKKSILRYLNWIFSGNKNKISIAFYNAQNK